MKWTLVVLLAVSGLTQHVSAGVTFSGNWRYGSSAGGEAYTASTANDSGSSLRQTCFPQSGNCYYVFNNIHRCEDLGEYPGMINSNIGSEHIELICKNNEFVINDFKKIDGYVRNAARIGIVVPLEHGDFSVSRFSLNGSTHAVDSMRSAALKNTKSHPSTASTADIRI